jgi:CxxC motif-containing protein
MKKRTLTCVVCPNGCELEVCLDKNNQVNVKGTDCKRGYEWAKQELINPRRTIASNILVDNGDWPLVSVRTDKPIFLSDIAKVMETIKAIRVQAPVKLGDVLIANAADTGASIIATRNVVVYFEFDN